MRASIGRYRITKKLGEGGMGTVFAAEDEKLGRAVAIKTIHPEIADASMRARMWREARAAASVNHPGVCQVYEVGESDDELFLAMELLEGEPLSDRMARGSVPVAEAVAITIEILEALHALHEKGFVHRDLKPSNVFWTPHGIKLLDFGLALPLAQSLVDEEERLTRTGMMIGTPAFMAPEQWLGSDVTPAADLFSAGALLFEMVSGEPAFQGRNALEIYNAIANEPTPSLTGGPAIEMIDRVVARALAPEPEDRFPSAAALAAELQEALPLLHEGAAASARRVLRLLVIPFRLLRPDEEIDFLPAGLADALVASLSGREGIIVKPGGAPQGEGELDLAALAKEARVQLVLTGTLLRQGNRLRVSAQVLAVPAGEVVWSETRQAQLDDLFALHDQLAGDIAHAMAFRLVARDTPAGRVDVPATGQAYEYYLRANQLSMNFGMLPAARDLYQAALREDKGFAPAWARLGRVYRVMAKYGHGEPDDLQKAEEAFRRALELNPDLAIAHNLFAYFEIEELGKPHDALARLLDRAHEAPTNPDLLAGLVLACRFCGLLEASVEADRRARRLDPAIRTSVAYTHWMRADYEAAMLADDEDMRWIHQDALPMLGRVEEAIACCREAQSRAGRQTERDMLAATLGALEGRAQETAAASRRVFESSFHDPEGWYFMARNAVHVGEESLGLEMLEAIVGKGFCCARTIANDAWLEPLGADGRLQPVVDVAAAGYARSQDVYREHGGASLLGALEDA